MTVNRADLAGAAHRAVPDVRIGGCEALVGQTFAAISDALVGGEMVKIPMFGTFDLLRRGPRLGRNPKRPDEEHLIPEHVAVRFRAARELRNLAK